MCRFHWAVVQMPMLEVAPLLSKHTTPGDVLGKSILV
jgi:hypothetical protein